MTTMSPETTKLVQEIIGGRLDDDLNDLATAIAIRVKDSLLTLAWRFRLDGVDVGELELTIDEAEELQTATGVVMSHLTPEANAAHLKAIGRVLLRTRGGLSAEQAAVRIGAMIVGDIPALISREVLDAPFASSTSAST